MKEIDPALVPKGWLWVMEIKPPQQCSACGLEGCSWGWRRQWKPPAAQTPFLCSDCGEKEQAGDVKPAKEQQESDSPKRGRPARRKR